MFTAGILMAIFGVLIVEGTRLLFQYYFSYVVSDTLIIIEGLPFFVVGGTLIAFAVGTIITHGDG